MLGCSVVLVDYHVDPPASDNKERGLGASHSVYFLINPRPSITRRWCCWFIPCSLYPGQHARQLGLEPGAEFWAPVAMCGSYCLLSLKLPPEPGPSIAEPWRILFKSRFLSYGLSAYSRPSAELFYIITLFSLHNSPINPILQIKYPLEKEWLPTPVFLPGESHGQRSLAGYRGRMSWTRLSD